MAALTLPLLTVLYLASVPAAQPEISPAATQLAAAASLAEAGPPPHVQEEAIEGMRTGVRVSLMTFIALVLVVGATLGARSLREHQLHQTVRMMIEKGVPIPDALLSPPRRGSDLRRGLVLVSTGLGVAAVLALIPEVPQRLWSLGLIPLLIGAAFLLVHRLERGRRQ